MNEKFNYLKQNVIPSEKSFSGEEFSDIRLDEMKELLNPLKEVIVKLKEKIKNNEFDLVIGDDASGRIPALILYKFLRDEYKKQNKDIRIVFLAGSRETEQLEDKKNKMAEFLQSQLVDNQNVLIVTELIHRGDSLVPLTDVLQKLHSKYDVATVGVLRKYRLPDLENKLGVSVIWGEEGHPKIDGSNVVAGVKKNYEDLFSTRLDMNEKERKIFLDGRHDVEIIASKLTQFYKTLI